MVDAEIRKQTVIKATSATIPDAANRDASFFDHVFEVIAATPAPQAAPQPVRPDPMRQALSTLASPMALDAAATHSTAFEKNVERMKNAYRTPSQNPVIGAH